VRRPRTGRVALIIAVLAWAGAMGCHRGVFGGTGSPCSPDQPCRSAFVCVAGSCKPSLAGGPSGMGGSGFESCVLGSSQLDECALR
jgi:hypothetical protein